MHELPQLGKLEEKYPDSLAVIGVQSPKYTAEAEPASLRAAVQRYGIRHPVVDDPDHAVWDSYSVTAWPTLVFLSPSGAVIGRHAGEAAFEALDSVMAQIVVEYEREGSLVRGPLPYTVAPFERPMSQFSFPGKVLPTHDRVFIADSDHHRIVVTDVDGTVLRVVGSGKSGLRDGDAASASFFRPQGMALDPASDTLYVADSENHAIRAVDLTSGTVRTIAGTGKQATRRLRQGPAREIDLSSPWDVAFDAGNLYIAMAGLHQIWRYEDGSDTVSVWAGTGHEALKDAPREQAWFAQPMGLCLVDGSLHVACAETQAIRRIGIQSGQVTTLAGRGLFDFGCEDGPVATATLQHCQGVTVAANRVFVADTYNNIVRLVDLETSIVSTYAGSGEAGELDGPGGSARFREPGGIAALDGVLWVADTNNHLIRTIELESGHVRAFAVHGNGLDVRGI